MLKVCKECGKEFETNRKNANLCNGEHTRTCIVCGKDFPVSHQQIRDNKRTCSRECTQAFQVLRMKECLSAKTKVCPECGKEFTPRNNNQVYCENDHYRPCPVCGKPVKVKHAADLASDVQRTCSDECLKIYLSTKMKEIKPKKEVAYRKCIICGKEFPLMWPYTAVTCSPRCKGIYCKESGIAEERTKKASKTCLERYGSDNPGKVPEFREAMTEKLLANYGVTHALKSSVILDKVKETNRKNFGTDWASQNEDVKRRYREKMVEKYGVDNYWKSSEHIVSMMSDPSKADNYLSFKEDPLGFILSRYSEKPTVVEICKDVGVTDTIIYNIINSAGVSEYVDHYRSKFESQIIDKLLEICPSIEIVEHDRLNIKPKELDIYLPEYSLAIECNPTYTHNSSFPTAWVPGVLPYDYHKKKTELCEAKGIRLFHIFGYQWTNKREIVVSMLRNLLKKNLRTVYARNTVVRNVSGAESMKFLDENHIQGRTQSAVRLGLYVGEELISLMTFSKPRHGSGYSKKYDDNTWELTRFCTKLNTTCVGGASKLFKYFLNEHSPSQVVSFSDRSITSGNLYEVLGFQNVGYVSPGYVWVKLQDDSYYSRVACQKQNLSKLLHEPDLDIVNQTEAQIMEGHGYARVYNSGLVKWQFCN